MDVRRSFKRGTRKLLSKIVGLTGRIAYYNAYEISSNYLYQITPQLASFHAIIAQSQERFMNYNFILGETQVFVVEEGVLMNQNGEIIVVAPPSAEDEIPQFSIQHYRENPENLDLPAFLSPSLIFFMDPTGYNSLITTQPWEVTEECVDGILGRVQQVVAHLEAVTAAVEQLPPAS